MLVRTKKLLDKLAVNLIPFGSFRFPCKQKCSHMLLRSYFIEFSWHGETSRGHPHAMYE